MKFVFLILHYQNTEVTISCINSIKRYCYKSNYSIVIVDNHSPNHSGVLLKNLYSDVSSVTVILSEKNLGYARGNNLGFFYIKKNLNPDYIIMINNDTELLDDSFLENIKKIDNNHSPAVIGPQIILANNSISNYPFEPVTIKYLKRETAFFHIKKILHIFFLSKLVYFLEKKGNHTAHSGKEWEVDNENVVLNGCCLIFTKKYINRFDGLYDKTFMYKEEQFLFNRLLRSNMSSFYSPKLKIRHLEGASTKGLPRKRAISFCTREIESNKLLISYLQNKDIL